MARFLVRRFFFALLTLVAATMVVFAVSRLTGDPRMIYARPQGYGISPEYYEALGRKLGLDKPLIVQYFVWLGRALKGDFGNTLFTERPVIQLLQEKAGATMQLALAAWVFATLVGVPAGVISAVNRGGVWDYVARAFALFGQAAPQFWIGIMGILIFAVQLGWLPSGTKGGLGAPLSEQLKYFVLPTIVMGWGAAAGYLRLTRSAMLEVLDSEYVRLARGKGVAPWKVIWKHAFANALTAPLTFSALQMAWFLSGSIIVEVVFGWPGLGRLAMESVLNNDFPTLTGCVLFFAAVFVGTSFATDVLYAFIDPRVRLG